MRHWFWKRKFIYGILDDTILCSWRGVIKDCSIIIFHRSLGPYPPQLHWVNGWCNSQLIKIFDFSNSWQFYSMIPFQPLLHTFHVVTHGSWPTFVNNPSVLDDVKADGKSTISDVCCVKHCIYHHGTSGNFSRHLACCTTSFGLRSVGSDFVVVLWKDVKGNWI